MYLITGATGHIGNNLIRALLEQNPEAKIRAFVLPNTPVDHIAELPIETVYGNVLEPASIVSAMDGVDIVFHLAAMISIRAGQEELVRDVNITGARNVAQAALKSGVKRMVHVGSIHIFERVPTGIIDETIPLVTQENAAGIYDYTKAEGVRQVKSFIDKGLDVMIACPTGVIGPHDYLGSEMGSVIRGYLTESIQIVLDGGYDWVDVRDVVQGLIRIAEKGTTGEIYLLGGEYIKLEAMVRKVETILDKQYRIAKVPYPIVWIIAHILNMTARIFRTTPRLTPYALRTLRDNANISHQKAIDEIGYTRRSSDETLKDTLMWYRDNT